ncbi:MAG: hypothetical protein N4A33_11795 [Bacteriovoracaceae bacterium]|nr:hypothetical protein [Bacteriovoracaceae bacterium]
MVRLFLFTLFIIQINAYSNICDEFFTRDFSKETIYIKAFDKKEFNTFYNKINQSKKSSTKMQYMSEYINSIDHLYNDVVEEFWDEVSDGYIDQTRAFIDFEILEKELISELRPHNNRIISELNDILSQNNINTKLVKNKETGMYYLELLESPNTSISSYKTLMRFETKDKYNVYTVDPFSNLLNGSQGFYSRFEKRIDIGLSGINSILINNKIERIIKHETYHALFEKMRKEGIDSFYHMNFISKGNSNLSKYDSAYNRYMSAEEIHNFSNDPYWQSDFLRDKVIKISDEKLFAKIDHLDSMLYDTKGLLTHSRETLNNYIKAIDKKIQKSDHSILSLLTNKQNSTKNLIHTSYLSIQITNDLHVYTYLTKKYKDLTSDFLQSKNHNAILEEFKSELVSLKKKTNILLNKTNETQQMLQKKLVDLKTKQAKNHSFYRSKEAKQIYTQIRKDLKNLGNLARD